MLEIIVGVQTLESVGMTDLLRLMFYRCALNHRTCHVTWSQALVEIAAHQLVQRISVNFASHSHYLHRPVSRTRPLTVTE